MPREGFDRELPCEGPPSAASSPRPRILGELFPEPAEPDAPSDFAVPPRTLTFWSVSQPHFCTE